MISGACRDHANRVSQGRSASLMTDKYLLLDERVLSNTLDSNHRKFKLSVTTDEEKKVVTAEDEAELVSAVFSKAK